MDSPVISDSSHVECPYITFPSTGTFAPGTTWKQTNYNDVMFGILTAMLLKIQVFWDASALLFLAFGRIILPLASVSNSPKSNITLKMKEL